MPYCPGRSPLWTISVNAPDQNAYYRLRFAGTQTLRVSVSKVRHLWREDTRITDFKVSPRHVHAKGAITISGRLWRAATTPALQVLAGQPAPWTPYAGRKVAIMFIYHGAAYVFNSKPKTNSQGDFSGLFTAYVTAKWLAQYNGDKTHFASPSPHVKVTVSGGSNKLLQLATWCAPGPRGLATRAGGGTGRADGQPSPAVRPPRPAAAWPGTPPCPRPPRPSRTAGPTARPAPRRRPRTGPAARRSAAA